MLELFEKVDVIIAPATPCVAPKLGEQTLMLDGVEMPLRANIGIYTQPISFIGLPVVAVPVPLSPLPIGVQIIAAPWREDIVLRVAQRWRMGAAGAPCRDVEDHADQYSRRPGRGHRAFARYEKALVTNDTATLDELFRPPTLRFGVAENLFGIEEIGVPRRRSPIELRAGPARPTSRPMAGISP